MTTTTISGGGTPDALTGADVPRRPSRPTVTDVARLAGVSRQTVSRVANGSSLVSPDTTRRVQRAIEELGYRTNMTARALATGRAHMLGVVTLPTTDHGPSRALFSIEIAAQAAGYAISVASLGRLGSFEVPAVQAAVDRLVHLGCAGIFVIAPWASEAGDLREVTCPVPLVFTDLAPGLAGTSVRFDEVEGSRAVVEHLLHLGHDTVWHVTGAPGWIATEQRVEGWRAALARVGAPVPPPLQGDWTSRQGYEVGQHLARDPAVTAVFAANDQTALGVVAALRAAGRDVPGDVSVVGYDDLPDAPFFLPPLTTVASDGDLGHHCVQELVRLLADAAGAPRHVVLPTRVVVRRSTSPPLPLRTLPPAVPRRRGAP